MSDFNDFNKKYLQYSPRLLQGLNKAGERSSFGASGEKGYLTNKAFNLLSKFCSFPGMGAAEFEFKSLPESLGKINKMIHENKLLVKKANLGPLKKTVYILCFEDQFDPIVNTYNRWLNAKTDTEAYSLASPKGHDYLRGTFLDKSPVSKQSRKGWISECDYKYPYMIFIDKKMAAAFIKHFYDNPNLIYTKKEGN